MTIKYCDYINGVCGACGHKTDILGLRRECGHAIHAEAASSRSPPPAPTHGPGTELKKLLATVGITATPDCSCNARAAQMDRQGCDWCEANIDTIVGWLREQAEARGLPFLDVAGRMLVRRAIRNARRAQG